MKYSQIIKKNKDLEKFSEDYYDIAIFSNIMIHQAKDICEYSLRTESINAKVTIGEYDNILQDSFRFKETNAVIIFWEIYNFIDGLQYKIELFSNKEFIEITEKIKTEIDIVFNNLINIPLILINKFSSLVFEYNNLSKSRLNELADILNAHINLNYKSKIKIIDADIIISKISINLAIDMRNYYSSKTLYKIDFYKEYFEHIKYLFLHANGKSKKALIFDCDNTLWKGILGEDGFNKIKIYKEIQYIAKNLARKGVIIGLCSKNNAEDVGEVLEKHKDIILKDNDIVIKKVNWHNKVSNLETIAEELNIGLDSIVFIDDSDFEVNLVREKLPMIKVFQVPDKEYEYSAMLRKISNLFYNPTYTEEDFNKVKMYKSQIQRKTEKRKVGNIENYLNSLNLEIHVYIDDANYIERISQMTQKTNQFNLTTKRYTENDIENFIKDINKNVVAIQVSDKFGDNGIVGLAILDYKNEDVIIETLLMSCRVLGRNIEYMFIDIIANIIENKKSKTIKSKYIKTYKNKQVSNFYDKCNFKMVKEEGNMKSYEINSTEYKYKKINYINVSYEK